MAVTAPSHLATLQEGWVLLRRHPGEAAALTVLAMVLSQLGPALELAAGA